MVQGLLFSAILLITFQGNHPSHFLTQVDPFLSWIIFPGKNNTILFFLRGLKKRAQNVFILRRFRKKNEEPFIWQPWNKWLRAAGFLFSGLFRVIHVQLRLAQNMGRCLSSHS